MANASLISTALKMAFSDTANSSPPGEQLTDGFSRQSAVASAGRSAGFERSLNDGDKKRIILSFALLLGFLNFIRNYQKKMDV